MSKDDGLFLKLVDSFFIFSVVFSYKVQFEWSVG